jgi:hypothetical protein
MVLAHLALSAVFAFVRLASVCLRDPWISALLVILICAEWWLVAELLSRRVLRDRVRYTLTPTRMFDPGTEEVWRYCQVLMRAARSAPWWAPTRAKSARLLLRADGTQPTTPLTFTVEAHSSTWQMLSTSPYGQVEVERAHPPVDKPRKTVLRAEFVLRGEASASLRPVPLDPDPLQPIVDAVSAVRADLGDLAEVVLDLQPVPNWRLRLKRWQLLAAARARAQAEARRQTRRMWLDADAADDTVLGQLATLVDGQPARTRRPLLPVQPRPVDYAATLGRLKNDVGLIRMQLFVRCASDQEGRAENTLKRLAAALDLYADGSRLRVDGSRMGPWQLNANHPLRRGSFDRRWATGRLAPRRDSQLNIAEITGLLKPPTAHCRLPITAGTLPVYAIGAPVVPQGWYRGPDGSTRLIGSPLAETLFSVAVGKSNYGKTSRAIVQALAIALAGDGVLFLDPHADSWDVVAPYLAHEQLRDRVLLLDLTGRSTHSASWNPLGADGGQPPHQLVRAVVDSIASILGWDDQSAPRAMTILTKCAEALVEINRQAVAAHQPKAQATLFQIRALLTDPAFRDATLAKLPQRMRGWWNTSFLGYGDDAFATVINPLDRLAADPVARALLAAPTGRWNLRTAMDHGKVIWVRLSDTGPTQRLLVNMLLRDVFTAGLSRQDLPPARRRPFHLFLDELIALEGAGTGEVVAQIAEQLRKFGLRLHVLAQLLERLDEASRASLLQNASVLSTTTGSPASIRVITDQWHEVQPAEVAQLQRFHHMLALTLDGQTLGPLRIRGPQADEVFRPLDSPKKIPQLLAATRTALGARTTAYLDRLADKHDATVLAFLTGKTPAGRTAAPAAAGTAPEPLTLTKTAPAVTEFE